MQHTHQLPFLGSSKLQLSQDDPLSATAGTLTWQVVGPGCRFNPEDERCGMELDDIDPASWIALEAAAEDYITTHDAEFDAAARALCHNAGAGTIFDPAQERLGTFTPPPPTLSPSFNIHKFYRAPNRHPSLVPAVQCSRGLCTGEARTVQGLIERSVVVLHWEAPVLNGRGVRRCRVAAGGGGGARTAASGPRGRQRRQRHGGGYAVAAEAPTSGP